jgi:Ca-activated chloride channel family protein
MSPLHARTPIALVALALIATATAPSQAPSAPPTFGTGVEIVNLKLSVSDAGHSFVTGLAAEDFRVVEDGVPQGLTAFTEEDLPLSLVLMIDASGSMREKLATAQSAALRFIRTLRPQDAAQVVEFNDRATVLQPFTSDREALEAAVRGTHASGSTALHNAIYVTLKELALGARSAQATRRAIVLFSDGADTRSAVSADQVLEAARRSELSVYTISLGYRSSGVAAPEPFDDAGYLMSALARETGGRAFFPAALGELDSVYAQVGKELRTLYAAGYTSSNARRDGRWRRIAVSVRGRADFTVRHKLGYYAPDH